MIALLAWLFFASPSPSGLAGDWTTHDNSVVRVYPCGGSGQLCARVVTVGPKDKPQTDAQNPDASLRGRALCGLTIGTGFTPSGDAQAKDGHIYDPESGKTYSAEMQVDGDALKLRGFIGISLLGRTEVWRRASGTAASCG